MIDKKRIEEQMITNLVNSNTIPADEAQLNLDVIHNSILDSLCSIVPLESPRQIISALRLDYDSENKSVNEDNNDVYDSCMFHTYGASALNDLGYATNHIRAHIGTQMVFPLFYAILPGTIKTSDNKIIDDGMGKLVLADNNSEVGTVDYNKGIIKFKAAQDASTVIEFDCDNYDLLTGRHSVKFKKETVEIFADLYQLDFDVAVSVLESQRTGLDSIIENISPQVLSQQIDQNIINKYFGYANLNVVGEWDASVNWENKSQMPINLQLADFGAYLNFMSSSFTRKNGVFPNVIICDPIGYNYIINSKNFIAISQYDKENDKSFLGLPNIMGYFNNQKIILANTYSKDNKANVILTYKGASEAQSAGVYAPFIPVTLRNIKQAGMESVSALYNTYNVYSVGGFAMVNPELVEGIKIKNSSI